MNTATRKEGFLLLLLLILMVSFLRVHGLNPWWGGAGGAVVGDAEGYGKEPEIDINTASPEELILIPGIGIKLAMSIVRERERMDGFRRKEDLKRIRGIGERKYHIIKAFVRVERPVTGEIR